MFGRKKDGAKISDRTPVFHVRYIGCTETFVATGRGCSYPPVQRLWDNSAAERNMRKVAIHINSQGLSLQDLSEKQTTASSQQQQEQQHPQHHYIQQQHPSHRNLHQHPEQQQQQQQQQQKQKQQPRRQYSQEFDIGNISFCNVDRAVNERIFSWIYRNDKMKRLDCHAVLCSTALKAQTMAIVLSRAFQIAYKDWRAHNRDYDAAVNRSSTSTVPTITTTPSSPIVKEVKTNNTAFPFPSAAAAATIPSPTLTSSMTSSVERTGEGTSSSPPHKSAHIADDVAVVTSAAPAKDVRSSVSEQQPSPTTSTYFGSSSIWDPEMEDLVGSVDCLQADLDLEEDGSY